MQIWALISSITLVIVFQLSSCQEEEQTKKEGQEYYYYNEITGETQWEDPGNVPFMDEMGKKFWLSDDNVTWLKHDPHPLDYLWVEQYSAEHKKIFYFNQATKTSSWEKPVDLAWRMVKVPEGFDEQK
eukprot:TRINITY_DN3811_c0_g2_i1.p2 TRINITY_DN3811_c0_g2~~TRINITY_DN3811_c0_g2_i1.p2  ORF type:complete len:128 (-),score=14.52 TRINITY_DN3811_c0_g2_i1:142-525(-)